MVWQLIEQQSVQLAQLWVLLPQQEVATCRFSPLPLSAAKLPEHPKFLDLTPKLECQYSDLAKLLVRFLPLRCLN